MLDFFKEIDGYHVWCLVSIRLSIESESETFTSKMLGVGFKGVKNSDNWNGDLRETETLLPTSPSNQ